MSSVADFVFYFFAAILIVAAIRVVTVRHPVHAALFLVLTFFSAAGIFVLLRAEFLAAVLVMVYMGAVAVLFLFVVMMLDVDFAALRRGALEHLPLGLTVGAVILVELVAALLSYHVTVTPPEGDGVPNTLAMGRLLYTRYLFPFEVASLVLLMAMVGAIGLTLRHRTVVRKQCISQQVARKREDAVVLKKVSPGEGA
ncbi:MAG: NADH-quinone oxidoreductase subunit J [Magnetococcales bacterium]|nr:NADH-quinone oxidoreductase subunit J [Magnetococcales bacterium]MBF0321906.1 NADH-quinone oxidoreductase subunit J [Magnetococcales bacterium]